MPKTTWSPFDLSLTEKDHILGGFWSKIDVTQALGSILLNTLQTHVNARPKFQERMKNRQTIKARSAPLTAPWIVAR